MGKHKKEKKEKKEKKKHKKEKKEKKERIREETLIESPVEYSRSGSTIVENKLGLENVESDLASCSSMADMLQQRLEAGLSQRHHVTASQKRREEEKKEMERLYNERLYNKPTRESFKETTRTVESPAQSDAAPQIEERHVNEHDINEAAANLMRAEMAGNSVKLARLRKNLDNLRVAKERGMKIRIKRKGPSSQTNPTSNMTRTTAMGMDGRRLATEQSKQQSSSSSVSDMMRNEKRKSSRDVAMEFTKMQMKMAYDEHFENEAGADSDDEPSTAKKSKRDPKDKEQKEKIPQKSMKPLNTSCEFCIHNRKKHLIISMGENCYLTLPANESLIEGHCYIVPVDHKPSGCHLDDDTWAEVSKFRDQLGKMLTAKYGSNCELVVMETAIQLQRFPHAIFECVPVWDNEDIPLISAFFKKSFQEAGPRWASNKKIVEIKGRNLKNAVPRGFPYISVSFEKQCGISMAHFIEDESLYNKHFAKEIIGGILDLDPSSWRNPRSEETNAQLKKVLEFEENWKKFDLWDST